jgi:hypothetical protein
VATGDEGRWGEARGRVRGNRSSLGRAPHGGVARQEVDGGTGEDVEVRGTGAEPVVVKPGVDGGRRWRPMWRLFPDVEGDGGLTDSGFESSSQCREGRGHEMEAVALKEPRNGGGGTGMVVVATVVAKGSWRWQRARLMKICPVIQAERWVLNL